MMEDHKLKEREAGEQKNRKKITTEEVATNVVASQPLEWWPIATPTVGSKIFQIAQFADLLHN